MGLRAGEVAVVPGRGSDDSFPVSSAGPSADAHGPLPIVVRRATAADAHDILAFTRGTFDGWDYVPYVWQDWLVATDGVVLVATPRSMDGAAGVELDLFGRPLTPDRAIAMARVTMLGSEEAWLEGLRVDPGVRRRSVASSIHVAAIAWARAQGATVVRYATGDENAGSHRIGEQHGMSVLGAWRALALAAAADSEMEDTADPVAFAGEGSGSSEADDPAGSGALGVGDWAAGLRESNEAHAHGDGDFEPDFPGTEDDRAGVRARATAGAARTAARAALRDSALVLRTDASSTEIDAWWTAIAADATFGRAGGLYESRPWRFQALTRERFGEHVRAGTVVVSGDPGAGWAVIVIGTDEYWRPGEHHQAALAAGRGDLVLRLALETGEVLGGPLDLRFPDPSPPIIAGHEEAYEAAGYHWDHEALHVLGRTLGPDVPPAATGPAGTLTFAEEPRLAAIPRSIDD
jgi:hypothetical protein